MAEMGIGERITEIIERYSDEGPGEIADRIVTGLGLKPEYGIDVKGRKKPHPLPTGGPTPEGWRPYQRYVTEWEAAG